MSEKQKHTNEKLLRAMIQLSNNSVITNEAANFLSQTLDDLEMEEMLNWLRHAIRQNEEKLISSKRRNGMDRISGAWR